MKKLLTLLILALCASPVAAQTFLMQIFSSSDRQFVVDVTDDAQVALTVMWNRQTAILIAVMVCASGEDIFEWAGSVPLQDRTLRMDVGVFSGLTCMISISTDRTAAFAVNFQSFAEGNLEKSGEGAVRIREAGAVEPEKVARMREKLQEATARFRQSMARRAAPPDK